MTEEGRRKRIVDLVRAWQDTEEKERRPLLWRGHQQLLPVVDVEVEIPLLNTKSHRIHSQLESHPSGGEVVSQPWKTETQTLVAELLREPRDEYKRLKDSLAREGQHEPGIITREGVLINANRRLVALRDLGETKKRWIRVIVLPADAEPKELAELELDLQLREELKLEYSLTNDLLFVEDLARVFGWTDEQIAIRRRWMTKKGKPDAAEVQQRRRILALIRDMQRLADPPIPLNFFDGKLEHLKALEQAYNGKRTENPHMADKLRKMWLATALTGVDSVHDLRAVYDENFLEEYLVPRLAGQDALQAHIDALLAPSEGATSALPGVDDLAPEDQSEESDRNRDVGRVINVLSPSQTDASVALPNGQTLDRFTVAEAILRATKEAIADYRHESRSEEQLDEPLSQLRRAMSSLRKAITAYRVLKGRPAFEATRHGSFDYLVKQVRKQVKELEDLWQEKPTVTTRSGARKRK